MKFSVVTPSFNQGRFIRDCLESVRAQAGVETEHLVLDAGSTDDTPAIVRAYPEVRWTAEPDAGMSDAINKGFGRATGDWVMWLNTDDCLLPGALAQVRDFAQTQPGADVIYGDCLFVAESKALIRRKTEHRFDAGILLFYGCYIPSTSAFIHRRVLAAGHLLDIRYKNCMDFDYYLRLCAAGCRFAYLPRALAAFRWHGENTSTQYAARRYQERVQIQREHLRRLGRPAWLGAEPVLSFLKRAYQAKRVALRLLTRHE